MTFSELYRNLPPTFGKKARVRTVSARTVTTSYPDFMFNDDEKEELRRIVNKFVEQRRCFRPIHPDQVLKEVKLLRETDDAAEEVETTEALPRFEL